MTTHPHELAFDRLDEEDFQQVLRDLRQHNLLEGAALGIARQLEDRGRQSLSLRQRRAFLENGWNTGVALECADCGCPILSEDLVWSKVWAGGRCRDCEWLREHRMKD